MIFYRINSAVPYLVATQAEAKRDARGLGCKFDQLDIPTDKEGLMAYLNGQESITLLDSAAQHPKGTQETAREEHTELRRTVTLQSIMEYLLDEASVSQVEQVFTALATRFKELANGR